MIEKKECTGCFGCYNQCSIKGAIRMQPDEEGFFKPHITNLCNGCGECNKVCPVLNPPLHSKNLLNAYAGWSNNEDIHLHSSSGGLFSEIASPVLSQTGVVYGAAWENGNVVHMRINKNEELHKLRGSKYLQSFIGDQYRRVCNDLKEGKQVLFCGVPCQVAALNKLTDHPNLTTIDLVCHGIPSRKAYEKYCNEQFKNKITHTNFRDKTNGWLKQNIQFFSGHKKELQQRHTYNPFMMGFFNSIYLNTACYDCKFRGKENGDGRHADITLGDFWGVPGQYFNPNGVSFITVNSPKGKKMIENLMASGTVFLKEVNIREGLKENPSYYSSPVEPKERALFFNELDRTTFIKLSAKYFKTDSKTRKFIRKLKQKIKNTMSNHR